MTKKIQILAWLSLFLVAFGIVWATNHGTLPSAQFTSAAIRLEYNANDKDIEVVIEAKSETEGLAKLIVALPDGQSIIDVTAPNTNSLGLRHFTFESPEPKDIKRLKKAYPEGEYKFIGTTSSGAKLSTKAHLSHTIVEPVSILRPKANAEGVSIKNLEIEWSPVQNAVGYILSIEQTQSDINFTAKLQGSVTRVSVPNGFLLPGKEYTLSIGSVTEQGNITYIETSFTTMKEVS